MIAASATGIAEAQVFEGFHMDDAGPDPDDQQVGDDDHDTPSEAGFTLEAYALELGLPIDWLKASGLSTVDNPWTPGRTAVGIPYRRRDGFLFRDRIRQAVRPVDTKRSRTLWDRRPERAQFHAADGYYATALHELGHWTGHQTRLNRDLAHPFGSEGYAR